MGRKGDTDEDGVGWGGVGWSGVGWAEEETDRDASSSSKKREVITHESRLK